jgi:hypothetical protein
MSPLKTNATPERFHTTPCNPDTEPAYTQCHIDLVEHLASLLVETKLAVAVVGDQDWYPLCRRLHSEDIHQRLRGAVQLLDALIDNPDPLFAALQRLRYQLAGK